jgi:hypothetical protein
MSLVNGLPKFRLVASQVSSQVTSRISKVEGISQLSINPVLAGGSTQGPPGANITIQQRATGNFFFTFSSNLATTQQQTIMGQYQVTPRVAISGTRDQNGGFGFDATIKKTWLRASGIFRHSIDSKNTICARCNANRSCHGRSVHSHASAVRGSIFIARNAGTSIAMPLSARIATTLRR